MNIIQILYRTVGDNFEKYLTGNDIMRMRHVSRIAHLGNITMRYSTILEHILEEHKIFIDHNQTLDMKYRHKLDTFLFLIPLEGIFDRCSNTYEDDININIIRLVIDYLHDISKITDITYNCIGMSIGREAQFISILDNELIPLCSNDVLDSSDILHVDYMEYIDYDIHYLFMDMIEQACIRNKPHIVEYIFKKDSCRELYCDIFKYYGITKDLRDIFIKYNEYYIEFLKEEVGNFNDDMFGLIETNCKDNVPLNTTLLYALRCNDMCKFNEYYQQYGEYANNIRVNNDNYTDRYKYKCYGYILDDDFIEEYDYIP